jgi:E3 ubiquitin-protein ligase EDD1
MKEPPFFIKIASLYSELVAITKTGQLYQWKWSSDVAYTCQENVNIHHPKTLFLNLLNEKIIGISTSTIRASVWTESGKIASWLDETVDISYTIKLQTPALSLYDPLVDSIQQLSVSNLFTVAKLSSGNMYWWGVMPYEHRCKLIEKYQSKAHKLKTVQTNDLTVGSYVSLKTFPLYNSGTVAITIKDGQPKIGQIMEHLFSFKDSKLFKFKLKPPDSFKDSIRDEMPPPASLPTILSLESIGLSSTSSSYSLKRKKTSSSDLEYLSSLNNKIKDEESWQLSDTIFVEDSKQFLLGKVIKIDNDHAIVKMQSKTIPDSAGPIGDSLMETQSLLDNCRILAKNQLQAVKLSSSFKLPDFIQKIPKKLSDIGNVITFVSQQNGIHALITKEGSIYYIFYDIVTNKIIKEKKMPTRTKAMFGQIGNQIKLNTIDDPNVCLSLSLSLSLSNK